MSKIEVGVGEDFPINDATDTHPYSCGRVRAHWAARRQARRERWRKWCARWQAPDGDPKPPAQEGDASYSDVSPARGKDS